MRARFIFTLHVQEHLMLHYHQNLLAEWIEEIKASAEQWCHYKDYNFSSIRGQATAQQEGLTYCADCVKLILSSPSQAFIDFFIAQVFGQKSWQLGPLQLKPVRVYREPVPTFNDSVKYLCISPLVPSFTVLKDEEAGKELVHPAQDLFSDLLYECTIARMGQSGLYSTQDIERFSKFQLVPDQRYLRKLKKQGGLFARTHPINYQGKQYETRTYIFPFTLYADKQVQAYVYTRGLGAFTQQGLGMLSAQHSVADTV